MSTFILLLLVLSALAELFGTATVALSYARGHQLAQQLIERAGPAVRSTNLAELIAQRDSLIQAWELQGSVAVLRREVAGQLERRWWLTAGIISYGLGALSGLAAGIIALYH